MKEHEKLKEICDLIGYKGKLNKSNVILYNGLLWNNDENIFENQIDYLDMEGDLDHIYIKGNLREIIFTPEFIIKLQVYLHNKKLGFTWNKNALLEHLDNPVDYLYDLLGLGNNKIS